MGDLMAEVDCIANIRDEDHTTWTQILKMQTLRNVTRQMTRSLSIDTGNNDMTL